MQIFLALTHSNWLSIRHSPRTPITVACSCEKLCLIFCLVFQAPERAVLSLPGLVPEKCTSHSLTNLLPVGKEEFFSHKSILNSWASTFFGMQILSPDVGKYRLHPKSSFRTSLTSYQDFWYKRELYSFLKDYSVFSWGRASSFLGFLPCQQDRNGP